MNKYRACLQPPQSKTMLFFSSTLLLAASCLLVHAGGPTQMVTTCEECMPHRLSCESDGVISVQTSLYGRADCVTCSEGKPSKQIINTHCSLAGAVDEVRKRCNGKKVCELSSKVFRRSDPCWGTAKYLQTTYTCVPAIHLKTCEHSLAHLQCAPGLVISVFGADYGRRDQSTCSFGRPVSQIQNTVCSSPTSKVAESCQGKTSCVIRATNSVFGDPCYKTFKYLEVAYTCQYPQYGSNHV